MFALGFSTGDNNKLRKPYRGEYGGASLLVNFCYAQSNVQHIKRLKSKLVYVMVLIFCLFVLFYLFLLIRKRTLSLSRTHALTHTHIHTHTHAHTHTYIHTRTYTHTHTHAHTHTHRHTLTQTHTSFWSKEEIYCTMSVWICNWWIMLLMYGIKMCEWVSECTSLWKDACYLNKRLIIMCLEKKIVCLSLPSLSPSPSRLYPG